jgi:hypothetical protein
VERIWGVHGGRGSSKQGVPRCRKNRAAGSDGGGTEEQPRAPTRGSRELTASVRSLGW